MDPCARWRTVRNKRGAVRFPIPTGTLPVCWRALLVRVEFGLASGHGSVGRRARAYLWDVIGVFLEFVAIDKLRKHKEHLIQLLPVSLCIVRQVDISTVRTSRAFPYKIRRKSGCWAAHFTTHGTNNRDTVRHKTRNDYVDTGHIHNVCRTTRASRTNRIGRDCKTQSCIVSCIIEGQRKSEKKHRGTVDRLYSSTGSVFAKGRPLVLG